MNIIFITLSNINSIHEDGIYATLMRKFNDEGHHVYNVSSNERRNGGNTHIIDSDGVKILKVRTLNIQKTNVIEKSIGMLLIERQYRKAIQKFFSGMSFDLITYSTPPITFTNVVKYLKKQNPKAISYLQLKDIFPQNAVDIGLFSQSSLIYKYFRHKEKALYKMSDYIGCMSPANVEFVRKNNLYYPADQVEVAPNSIELRCTDSLSPKDRIDIRVKYGLPIDIPIFIYGGNLGKPQGIDFLISCLDANKARKDCFFVIIGNGTEFHKIEAWLDDVTKKKEDCNPMNIRLMQRLSEKDYGLLVRSCDVGLIYWTKNASNLCNRSLYRHWSYRRREWLWVLVRK